VTRAVFFDVDFTLIHPGPTFRGEGYQQFCAQHGIDADPSRFEAAVAAASAVLEEAGAHIYEAGLFHRYTAAIITGMGGEGPQVDACAQEIYAEWAGSHHFELYDDVPAACGRSPDAASGSASSPTAIDVSPPSGAISSSKASFRLPSLPRSTVT
jgi:hypothetical protein